MLEIALAVVGAAVALALRARHRRGDPGLASSGVRRGIAVARPPVRLVRIDPIPEGVLRSLASRAESDEPTPRTQTALDFSRR